jgi:hypothetical protein
MTKIIVEFEVDTSKVGLGYLIRKLEMNMNNKDVHGITQIKYTKICGLPDGWA